MATGGGGGGGGGCHRVSNNVKKGDDLKTEDLELKYLTKFLLKYADDLKNEDNLKNKHN